METLASALPDGHPVADELARLHKVLENRSQTAHNLFSDLHESIEASLEEQTPATEEALMDWENKIELLILDLEKFGIEPSLEKFVIAAKGLSDDQRSARLSLIRPAA